MSNVGLEVADSTFKVLRCGDMAVYTTVTSPLPGKLSPRDYTQTSKSTILDLQGAPLFEGPCWLPTSVASESSTDQEGLTTVIWSEVETPLTIMSDTEVVTFTLHTADISDEALHVVEHKVPATHAAVLKAHHVPDVSGSLLKLASVHKRTPTATTAEEPVNEVINFGSDPEPSSAVKTPLAPPTAPLRDMVAQQPKKGPAVVSGPSNYAAAVKSAPKKAISVGTQLTPSMAPAKMKPTTQVSQQDSVRNLPAKEEVRQPIASYVERSRDVKLQLLGHTALVSWYFDLGLQSFPSTYLLSQIFKRCKSGTPMSYDTIKHTHTTTALTQAQVHGLVGEVILDMMSYPVLTMVDMMSAEPYLLSTKLQMDTNVDVLALANHVFRKAMRESNPTYNDDVPGATLEEIISGYTSMYVLTSKAAASPTVPPVAPSASPIRIIKNSVEWTLVSEKLMVFTSVKGTIGVVTEVNGGATVLLVPEVLPKIKCLATFKGYAAFLKDNELNDPSELTPESVLDAFLGLAS